MNPPLLVIVKTAAARVSSYLGPLQFFMIAFTFQVSTYGAVSEHIGFIPWVSLGLAFWTLLAVLIAWLDWRFVFHGEMEIYREKMGLKREEERHKIEAPS